jgi:TonB-linked SusC/RagA family outer membrane protein
MKIISTLLLIILFGVTGIMAQNKIITGKITTQKGDPLVGVTVSVKGSTLGTVSKTGGIYSVSVPANAKTLIFRFVGMKTKEVPIGSDNSINVALDEDAVYTSEVVVTAIGMEREKKSLGYSIEELKGSQISEAKTTNLVNAINGKVAGVNVVSSSGTPGGASFITIRGISSLTGENQPLFVVDGIPIDNSQSYSGNPDDGANNLLNGVSYSNRAIDLNPDDIESMTVLKGPSATALYGIRAASGAIIITTKKGKMGVSDRINVSANISYGIDEVNKLPELQNKWGQGASGAISQPGTYSPNYSYGPLVDTLYYDGIPTQFDKNGSLVGVLNPNKGKKFVPYDNMGTFFRPGQTLNANLALTGGNEFSSFYLSVSESKTFEGVVPNSDFERTSIRFNGDAKIASFLKAGANISYSRSGGTRIQQGSNISGVMLGLLRSPITFDNSNGYGRDAADSAKAYMYPLTGTQRTYRGETGDGRARYDNPFWTTARNPFNDVVDRVIGNLQLDAKMNDNITFMTRFGGDHYSDSRKQIFAIHSNAYLAGQVTNHEMSSTDINWDNILTFNYNLTDDLNMKLALGQNLYQSKSNSLYVQGDELIIPEFYHLSNTSTQLVRNSLGELRRSALYGDLTLNYLSWLYVNAALRNEWSTSLPEDNNSFLFGTVNLSFVFTEAFADVFKDTPISFGKFRANYAVVGKDAPIYATNTSFTQATMTDGWTNGVSFPFNGFVGFTKGDILGNTKLTPEITKSWEVGFALNFLDNRIGFDFTYYNSVGYDQIFSVPIAYSTGYARQIMNAGQISNKGFEVLLNATPVLSKDFRWDFMLNFAKNDNMVDKLAPGIENLTLNGFVGTSVRAVAGMPYGTIFGPGWVRDDKGNILIGANGYPTLNTEETAWGTFMPDWTMGITNSFKIYGVNLSFLIDFREGGLMWNGTKGALTTFGMSKNTETRGDTMVFVGVKSDGSVNDIKVAPGMAWFRSSGGGFSNNTEDFVESTSWIRLREVTLSYTLPRTLFTTQYFPDLTISFTGRNLWLSTDYSGIDPETSLTGSSSAQGMDYFNMPNIKSYVFGLSVNF